MNEWRVKDGDQFAITTAATVTNECFARVIVTDDNGQDQKFETQHTPTSDRILASTIMSGFVRGDGYVTRCTGGVGSAGVKRGELFAELVILDRTTRNVGIMAAGYIGDERNLNLGVIRETTEGRGLLHWVQEGNDVAGNVTTTVNLAATNARRMIRGIVIKYHQVGGADATITLTLRDMATAVGPTNWTIASDTWVSPSLVLAANQEGLIHVGEHGFLSTNDAGTIAYADNTSAPNPFPLEVQDADTVDLLIAASGGASGDDYDVWVQYEEWIEP